MVLLLLAQLWHSYGTPYLRSQGQHLVGMWQSCSDYNGEWGELAFPKVVNGKFLWTFHMGPHHEFALYKGEGPEGDHSHNDKANLLGSAYDYDAFRTKAGGRTWRVESLKLLVNVIASGGSRDDCESFAVLVEDIK